VLKTNHRAENFGILQSHIILLSMRKEIIGSGNEIELLLIYCGFVNYFQLQAEVVKRKSTEFLTFSLCLANFIVSLQWCVYGLLVNDNFITVSNNHRSTYFYF